MEAITLKTALRKQAQQEKAREAADRRKWQSAAGVKTVSATPPEGGW